jgi:hypothetical protein
MRKIIRGYPSLSISSFLILCAILVFFLNFSKRTIAQTIINGVLQISASNFTGVSTFASGSTTTFASGSTTTFNNSPSFTAQTLFSNGSSGTPSISFTNSPTQGLYFSTSTVMGLTGGLSASSTLAGSGLQIGTAANSHIAWGTANVMLGGGSSATIASGFGTSPSIAGAGSAFRVTLGTPVGQSGVVNFNNTGAYAHPPVAYCYDEVTAAANPPTLTVTATQLTITFSTAVAADTVACFSIGLP